jgi:hypothetical protein
MDWSMEYYRRKILTVARDKKKIGKKFTVDEKQLIPVKYNCYQDHSYLYYHDPTGWNRKIKNYTPLPPLTLSDIGI